MAKSKMTTSDPDEDDYKAQSDADALQKAQEIQADPDRHAAAKGHLDKRNDALQNASAQAESVAAKHAEDEQDADTPQSTAKASGKVNLRKKIKVGMTKAFPRD